MKNIFKNFTNSVIVLSILAILLGVVMIVYPGISLIAFGLIVASYLLVNGITLIILDIKAWRLYIPFNGLLQGILCVLMGILLAMYPETITVYIGTFVGFWIILSSFDGIKLASALRGTSAPWVLMIIMNIIDIIIGCLVIYSPILSSISLTVGLGVVLIIHAVINIVDMIMVKKNAKDMEKLIVEKE
ncbi:MAG: DUF308 domain-containing protein [Clostridia bacterium]|nr:DUF308 domain-containing protein [Clostridia bacterium]